MNKKPKVNTELRQWARGVSFTIAMGRRQVYTLISLHLSANREWNFVSPGLVGSRHRQMCSFVTSGHCLVDRGLVLAHVWSNKQLTKTGSSRIVSDLWQLTRAGELVIELLKESGIYEEVRTDLEAADKPMLRMG